MMLPFGDGHMVLAILLVGTWACLNFWIAANLREADELVPLFI